MALRPRLSTGLLVSDDWDRQLNGAYVTTPSKTCVKGILINNYVRFAAVVPCAEYRTVWWGDTRPDRFWKDTWRGQAA